MITYENLIRENLPEYGEHEPILNAYQAFGMLTDRLEKFWKDSRNEEKFPLKSLVNLSVACQLIAESLFSIERVSDSEAEYYKDKCNKLLVLFSKLMDYITFNSNHGEPLQHGRSDTVITKFESEFLSYIKKELSSVS